MLYTANLDPRKNLDGLFKAYSLLKSDVKKCLKLVIVSFVDSTSKAEMISLAKKMGVSERSANILFNTLSNLESEVNLDQTLFEADKVFFEKMKGLLFDLKDSDLKKISQSVESIYGNKMPSLYIDITAIAEFDAKTGIQRVV